MFDTPIASWHSTYMGRVTTPSTAWVCGCDLCREEEPRVVVLVRASPRPVVVEDARERVALDQQDAVFDDWRY